MDEPHLDENGFVILDDVQADDPDAIPAHVCSQAIVECGMCDGDGYRGAAVCDHRPHSTPEVRQAAREALRAALTKTKP